MQRLLSMQRLFVLFGPLLALVLLAAACAQAEDDAQELVEPVETEAADPDPEETEDASSATEPAAQTATAEDFEPVTITLGFPTGVTSMANSDIAVAKAHGFFDEVGLTVETQNFRSGLTTVQAVVADEIEIGAASIEPVVNAVAAGGELVIIGGYADRLTVSMVTPERIGTVEDLAGQNLGVQDVGAFREVMTRMVLEDVDLTPDDVSYLPVEAQAYISALLQGQIASAILHQEQAIEAINRDPSFHSLRDLYEVEPDYYYGTYFTSRSWLADNEDVARRFLTALVKAHRFMYENREEVVPTIAEVTGFDAEVIDEAYEILLEQNGVFPVNAGLEEDRIEYTLGRMAELGTLEAEPPAQETFVNRELIGEVIDEFGAWEDDPRWH